VTFPRGLAPPAARWLVVHRSSRSDHGAGPWIFWVSSNGTQNSIIWAVGRPVDASPANVTLYAFDPVTASLLFSSKPGEAGTWPNHGGNAKIVSIVAKGHVYVANFKQLSIFGPTGSAAAQPQTVQSVAPPSGQLVQTAAAEVTQLSTDEREIFGTIQPLTATCSRQKPAQGRSLMSTLRKQCTRMRTSLCWPESRSEFLEAITHRMLQATSITRAKASSSLWPRDR
jgi:hypothetical protein